MANDSDWVEDVKRWYLAGGRSATAVSSADRDRGHYSAPRHEAVSPTLKVRHRPEAPLTTDR